VRGYWLHDGWRALEHAVAPVFGSAVIACAAAWALFAAVLPLLVRGQRLAADVTGAAIWAGGLYAAMRGVEHLAGPGVSARGALGGAVAAALLAVAAAALRRSGAGPARAGLAGGRDAPDGPDLVP